MKATGVISRFLSLLDVVLVLLGMLMVALMQAQLRSSSRPKQSSAGQMAQLADVDFVYLYAGWKGPEEGRCYLLNPNGGIGEEVRTDTPDDIRRILENRKNQTDRRNQLVLLLFSEAGWGGAWPAKKLAAIEKKWKVKVVPVYNVPRLREKNP